MKFVEFLSLLPFSSRKMQADFEAALCAAKAASGDEQILQKAFEGLPSNARSGLIALHIIDALQRVAGPRATAEHDTSPPPAVVSPQPRAAKPQRPAATVAPAQGMIAELQAQVAVLQKTNGEQAACITALQGELAKAKAGEAAAIRRVQDVERNVETRASMRAQEILASAGCPPVVTVTKGNPAAKDKAGHGQTGMHRMAAVTREQIEEALRRDPNQ